MLSQIVSALLHLCRRDNASPRVMTRTLARTWWSTVREPLAVADAGPKCVATSHCATTCVDRLQSISFHPVVDPGIKQMRCGDNNFACRSCARFFFRSTVVGKVGTRFEVLNIFSRIFSRVKTSRMTHPCRLTVAQWTYKMSD
jgi:hypothetical protein